MTCRSCNSKKINPLLSLKELYLSDFVPLDEVEKPPKYPLDLVICEECKLVQLEKAPPSDEMYTERYGYKSGINNTIKADLAEVVSEVSKIVSLGEGDRVVDIGANDGTLLSYYPTNLFRVGFEPIAKLAKECEKHADYVYNNFFFNAGSTSKVITAISCFYDLEDPNRFLRDIGWMLAPQGVFVIQQNYVGGMLKQNAFDNIVHEHIEYYSLFSLEHLLSRHNLQVFRVTENGINGGSFRTFICRKGERDTEKSVIEMRVREKELGLDTEEPYKAFAERVELITQQIHALVRKQVDEGKTVYTYGASTRGNTLLQACGLDNTLIKAAVERNPEKWGLKIASLDIPIISEEQARSEKPDYLLVLPWYFKVEFIEREKTYLESGGHFIFPLPELEVV